MLEKVKAIRNNNRNIEKVYIDFFSSSFVTGISLTVEFYDGEIYEDEGDDIDKVIKEFEEWLKEEYNVPEQG